MITTAHRMESLSRAYLQAIAAQAGLNYGLHAYDYGVDITLREVEQIGGIYSDSGRAIDVQLKSTTTAIETDDEFKYDLDVRTYDHLRDEYTRANRILVLLLLPSTESEWIEQSHASLSLRRCAYWLNLRGSKAVESASTVRVHLPKSNILSAQALQQLIARPVGG